MRPTGQIPFSLQSVNRQRLTDGYVPPAISGQWLIDELGNQARKTRQNRSMRSRLLICSTIRYNLRAPSGLFSVSSAAEGDFTWSSLSTSVCSV